MMAIAKRDGPPAAFQQEAEKRFGKRGGKRAPHPGVIRQ